MLAKEADEERLAMLACQSPEQIASAEEPEECSALEAAVAAAAAAVATEPELATAEQEAVGSKKKEGKVRHTKGKVKGGKKAKADNNTESKEGMNVESAVIAEA